MKARAQLTHSLRDVGMWNKPKMKAYRMKFGHLARVWYDDMIDALSGATNATIEVELALGMALEVGLKNGEEILGYCLERGLLISESSGTVSSTRVIEDQEKLALSREKYREKHRRSSGAAPEQARKTVNSVPVPDTEDLNKETVSLPEFLNTPENTRLWNLWERQSAANGRKLNDIYREQTWMRYATRPADLAIDLKKTLSVTSAKNIIEESTRAQDPPGKSRPKTNFERNMEILERSNETIRNQQAAGGRVLSLSEFLDK